MFERVLIPLLLSPLLIACPGGEDAPAPEAAPADVQPKAAPGGQVQMPAGVPQNVAEMMAGMQKMAQGGGQQVVDPLHFRELYDVFPDVSGWEKGKPTGQTMNMPYTFSQAEAAYTKGDAKIEINAVDGGWHPMMLAPYAMFLRAGFERETSSGYEKTTTYKGEPGWEKWDGDKQAGELNIVVKDRFLIQIKGRKLSDVESLKRFAEAVDIQPLVKAAEEAEAKRQAAQDKAPQ